MYAEPIPRPDATLPQGADKLGDFGAIFGVGSDQANEGIQGRLGVEGAEDHHAGDGPAAVGVGLPVTGYGQGHNVAATGMVEPFADGDKAGFVRDEVKCLARLLGEDGGQGCLMVHGNP